MPSTARLKSQNTLPTSVGGTGKITEFRKGFVDGLGLTYVGRNAVTIGAGAAYIPSIGSILEVPNDLVLTGLTWTASVINHLYLYSNSGTPTIEVSTTAPVKYYGTAYQKTGDSSRRYLGSVLAGAGGTPGIYKFYHNLNNNEMEYTEGTPAVTPFLLTNAWGGTAPSPQSTNAIVPIVTATHIHLGVQTTGLCYFALPEQQSTPNASNFMSVVGIGTNTYNSLSDVWLPLSRASGTLGQHLIWVQAVASAVVTTFTYGYRFER